MLSLLILKEIPELDTLIDDINLIWYISHSYQRESAELQHRKLGDLSFLVQHYDLAYNSYHSAKREFNNDHAWLYFAGALVSEKAYIYIYIFYFLCKFTFTEYFMFYEVATQCSAQ